MYVGMYVCVREKERQRQRQRQRERNRERERERMCATSVCITLFSQTIIKSIKSEIHHYNLRNKSIGICFSFNYIL